MNEKNILGNIALAVAGIIFIFLGFLVGSDLVRSLLMAIGIVTLGNAVYRQFIKK